MENIKNVEAENVGKQTVWEMVSLGIVLISIVSFSYGLAKSEIISYSNGQIVFNSNNIPVFAWIENIKNVEKN